MPVKKKENDSHAEDRAAAVAWAREIVENPDEVVVLDSETTGLKDSQFCEISVLDGHGLVLFDSLVKPTIPVEEGARKIHGISDEDLEDAPDFGDVWIELKEALEDRRVIVYNTAFDRGVFNRVLEIYGFGSAKVPPWECAMLQYAKYRGEWNERYGNYRWPKLEGGDHSALGDCRATLGLIRRMAEADTDEAASADDVTLGEEDEEEIERVASGRGSPHKTADVELATKNQVDRIAELATELRGEDGVARLEQTLGKKLAELTHDEAEEWVEKLTPEEG